MNTSAGMSVRRYVFLCLVVLGTGAIAQDYPNRTIRIVHGFATGGNADVMARILAAEMTKGLGQAVVVEPRPAALGSISADYVAKSTPDGYTLLKVLGGHLVSAAIQKTLPYHAVDSFAWISTAANFPFVIATRGNHAEFRAMGDLVKAARVRPGKMAYGSAGLGGTQHLAAELLASSMGVSLLHVPYKGEAASFTGLASSDVDFIVAAGSGAMPLIKSGTLRALATTQSTRWGVLPDLPTVAESGFPGYDVTSWSGLAGPAAMPRSIVDRLASEMHRLLKQPEVRARIEGLGGQIDTSTPDQMRERAAADLKRWTKVVQDAKIEPR